MRSWVAVGCLVISACGNNEAVVSETARTTNATNTTAAAQTVSNDTNTGLAKDADTVKAPSIPVMKRPSGIYQFLMPYSEIKILHTVAFYPTSFRLQEEYAGKDSVVVTEGSWSPSQGKIWLYKDQIVRGRYIWKGDTLQYFSPQLQKMFSMRKLTPAANNAVWRDKRKEGAILYGVGTEPFWSIEINRMDTLTFSSPEWASSLKVKLVSGVKSRDSTVYTAAQDSLQVIVYPFFCSDGMSDFTYTNKVKIIYKGQLYKGCGVLF